MDVISISMSDSRHHKFNSRKPCIHCIGLSLALQAQNVLPNHGHQVLIDVHSVINGTKKTQQQKHEYWVIAKST